MEVWAVVFAVVHGNIVVEHGQYIAAVAQGGPILEPLGFVVLYQLALGEWFATAPVGQFATLGVNFEEMGFVPGLRIVLRNRGTHIDQRQVVKIEPVVNGRRPPGRRGVVALAVGGRSSHDGGYLVLCDQPGFGIKVGREKKTAQDLGMQAVVPLDLLESYARLGEGDLCGQSAGAVSRMGDFV